MRPSESPPQQVMQKQLTTDFQPLVGPSTWGEKATRTFPRRCLNATPVGNRAPAREGEQPATAQQKSRPANGPAFGSQRTLSLARALGGLATWLIRLFPQRMSRA